MTAEVGGNPQMSLWMWQGDSPPGSIQPYTAYLKAKSAAAEGFHGLALLHYTDNSRPDEWIYLTGRERNWGDVLAERGDTEGGNGTGTGGGQ